MSILCSFVMTD